MHNRHPGGNTDTGFTLIEMLVVVAILGLAAAVLMVHGAPHSAGVTQRTTASRIVQDLRFARSTAIARGSPVIVDIDGPHHRLLINGAGRESLPASLPLRFSVNGGPGMRQAAFVFTPDGSATAGSIFLGMPGQRTRIAIDWLTGRIDVSYVR